MNPTPDHAPDAVPPSPPPPAWSAPASNPDQPPAAAVPAQASPTPAATPSMRPPAPGEQLYGWNPPPPPGWTPQRGGPPPVGWVPPPGAYLPAPPPMAPNGQPLGSFGDRLLAFMLDYVIHFAFAMITTVPIYLWWFFSFMSFVEQEAGTRYDPYTSGPDSSEVFTAIILPMFGMMAAIMMLNLLFTYLYFVEYQFRRGQTVGKKVMKLKITPLDPAAPLTRMDLVKRWGVATVVGSFVPFFNYLDGFWQLWDKPFQQCLHDKAAKTVVIKVG